MLLPKVDTSHLSSDTMYPDHLPDFDERYVLMIIAYFYLRQGGNVFAGFCSSVCLFVCLSVCQQDNSKSY